MNMCGLYIEFCSVIRRMLLLGSSINTYISEDIEYHNFIKWYRDNKKCFREFEMKEICLSPLTVTGISFDKVSSTKVVLSVFSDAETNVVSFHLKLGNGIEINKENANIDELTRLLQSLNAKSYMNFYQ